MPPYLAKLDAAGKAVEEVIARYADGGRGYKPFDAITADDLKLLQARLADLSELLGRAAGPPRAGGVTSGRRHAPSAPRTSPAAPS